MIYGTVDNNMIQWSRTESDLKNHRYIAMVFLLGCVISDSHIYYTTEFLFIFE